MSEWDGSSPSATAEPDEERYRPGARRTAAEPLAASWRPDPTAGGGARKHARRGFFATYGWRVYAVPVLLAVTGLVVVQTAADRSPETTAAGLNPALSQTQQATTTPGPALTERPPVDLDIPSAELPSGGSYAKSGSGEWRVLAGSGKQVGEGRLYTYTVEVEGGIPAAQYGGDDVFAGIVDGTLSDPRGWTSLGEVAVRRVGPGENADFQVSLTTPETTRRVCGFTIKYDSSCAINDRVVLNLARWVRGAVAFEADVLTYRKYVINHEVGHVFDLGHVGCAKTGDLAPVMMQQTFGVANDYVHELNRASGGGGVPKDGKVCKPNAWPNPQARPGN
ncbi:MULTISPECIES: DUF3152 domain-containing protein [Actinokineospora]|uniref:DUF3152 domain-containing protein n=1 Tax=Actinokineospora fastidiosa TaxID=1816 RepID=A0A918G2F8_9PSEU|nr:MULTISPECIES: DUF3152 domain-containing protein [Actinokineospora]UVS77191.1 hypothetical protein Actkin_00893 [Actinokineospora sp. UTMC 2448]GGS12851.1 hypothetical protein GCM10010171_00680 [Actinokineospora fastidiosa]